MLSLQQVDQELTNQFNHIRDIVEHMRFSAVCEFELTDKSLNEIPWKTIQYPGIYFIEIKNCNKHASFESWVTEFQANWTDEKYKRKFVSNPKRSRINKHVKLTDWIPLYIGKSKNISKRFREHVYLGLDKPTFALKLLCREHLKPHYFRLSSIEIKVENYDWIMPVLEYSFRNKINPIVGRQ